MITVHHLNNSRSQRILWLLEELKIPYEVKRYDRDKITMLAPESLKAVHPLGKSPVITDNELVIAESGAIIDYLVNKYGADKLKPKTEVERLRYTYFLHYAEGSVMSPLLLSLIFGKIESTPMPFFVKPIAKGISRQVKKTFINPQLMLHASYMESELDKSLWFAGPEFSGADIQMSFPLEAGKASGIITEKHPKILEYLNRIHARPAYKRALEKGGVYDIIS